jgi:hypothetical protein
MDDINTRRVSYSEAYETFRKAQAPFLWPTAFPKREAIGIGQSLPSASFQAL